MGYVLRRCLAVFAGLTSVVVGMSVAQAAPRTAVLLPDVQPAVSVEVQQRFHEAAANGFEAGVDPIVPAAEVRMRLSTSAELAHCSSGSCTAQAAALLGVAHVVTVRISVLGKDYAIKMASYDASGQEVARIDDTCDVCTVREVVEALRKDGTRLANDPRALQPVSTPSTVPVARLPEPVPPAERPVAPTEPERPLPVAAVPTTSTPPTSLFPWRGLGAGAIALGAVSLGVGIALLVIDGRPTCDLPDPTHSCPQVYNTVGGGAALTVIGVAALATGGVFFYLDHRQRQAAPRLSLSPLLGGGQLTARWEL